MHNLATYIDVSLCTKSYAGLISIKLGFKVASPYILPQCSDICLQKVMIYAKQKYLGRKKV